MPVIPLVEYDKLTPQMKEMVDSSTHTLATPYGRASWRAAPRSS